MTTGNRAKPPTVRLRRLAAELRRLRAGHFKLKSMSNEIYTRKNPDQRVDFYVQRPTPIWWNRI